MAQHRPFLCALVSAALVLPACGDTIKTEAKYPTGADRAGAPDIYSKPDSIFGPDGLTLGGDRGKKADLDGIVVNGYLWRAALDTVSFTPLSSVDPFGGVILTDWYSPPEEPGERLKLNVFITGSQLRAEGVTVRVFRQVRKDGGWADTDSDLSTGRTIEDAILTRARQLRLAQVE
ncbi:MAG TPA: DUF3576 domain-containing protein [Rhodospirillaceae bacterium]|jgi:hypothetical protein|nr:DUF3576 domain-containing protein [Alphaproteobacteria bacterium]HBH26655.1 DUF3576 domain-containing protein [Rhodospirillaceae bacterium]